MKDYSAMSDLEINKSVAAFKTEVYYVADNGEPVYLEVDPAPAYTGSDYNEVVFDPCNNPADAWPIITANHIGIMPFKGGVATAWPTSVGLLSNAQVKHENPLRAAMIVYLQMMEQKS